MRLAWACSDSVGKMWKRVGEDLSPEPGPAACASDWLDSLSIRLTGLPLHVLCSEIRLLKLLSDPELNFTFLFLDLLMEKLFLGSAFVFELHIFRLSWVTPSWLDPLCPHGMRASNALINLLASQILESCESATLQPGNRVDYLLPQISVSSQNGAVKHAVG